MGNTILEVNDLHVGFVENKQYAPIVSGITFSISKGEILGIVGESGSGKSITSLAIMDLLKHNGKVKQGQLIFEGSDLLTMTNEEKRRKKANEIAMIFQEPMTSLNPVSRSVHR